MKRRTALAALAAATAAPTRLFAQGTPQVRVLLVNVEAAGQAFYAKDLGMFDKAGLDVSISSAATGGAIIAAVSSGAADIGYANAVSAEIAFKNGAPITFIAPAIVDDHTKAYSWLIVGKDSPIKTARDLDGKTIGITGLRSLGEFAVRAWIDKNGGDSSKSKYLELPFPTILAAIEQGRVDAAFDIEPFYSDAKDATRSIGLPYEGINGTFVASVWFSTQAWAKAHPQVVRSFANAVREAGVWSNGTTLDKTTPIIAKYTKIEPVIVAKMGKSVFAPGLTPALIQPTIDLSAKYKAIDAPFSAQDVIFSPGR
jgi:NitT/TauT family transport system substrate-binding protein